VAPYQGDDMFWFKKQKVYMDAFTSRPEVFNFAPIEKATKFVPSWWKNLPNPEVSFKNYDAGQQNNMKHCAGFINYFKESFSIPMWSDLNLEIGAQGTTDYRWQFSDKISSLIVHPAPQRGTYLNKNKYQHFKLDTPWIIKTNKLILCSWSAPTWSLEEPEKIVFFPAIVDFYNQCHTAINIACPRDFQTKEIFIPFGQPLIHIIPMTEKEVILKTHLVSDLELEKIDRSTFFELTFVNAFSKLKKQ
jgi:hypothetical protein